MWERINPKAKLALIFSFYIVTVITRGFVHVYPWEALWFAWVGCHSFASACFGFYLAHYVYVDRR